MKNNYDFVMCEVGFRIAGLSARRQVARLDGAIVMGGIIEFTGLEASFLIIGAALMALLAVHVKRTPGLSE